MKKKLFWLLALVILLCLIVVGLHRTTIRYVDRYGASIAPDKQTRVVKAPFELRMAGYRFKKIHYSHRQHLLVSQYTPQNSPLTLVRRAKYIGVTFQPTTVPVINHAQQDPFNLSRSYHGLQSGRDTLRILIGDSYNRYRVLSANYPAVNVRDPSIIRQGHKYYIIYTRGLMSTNDFEHWKQEKWPAISGNDYLQDWAPEFVKAQNGQIHVVMSICRKGSNEHHLAITSFTNGKIGTKWTRLTGNLPANTIDPDIQYADGRYYLVCKNERTRKLILGISNNINGPYQVRQIKINSAKFESAEGPEALIEKHQIRVSFDTYRIQRDGSAIFYGWHYIEKNLNDKKWSRVRKVNGPIVFRHGQIILNKQ